MKAKLTPGQLAALRWLASHPATLLWNTAGDFKAQCFWQDVAPAKIQSFHSLVRLGLAEARDGIYYYITDEGRKFLS